MRPRTIILNGTDSVGKSSTAKALQSITADPFRGSVCSACDPKASSSKKAGFPYDRDADQADAVPILIQPAVVRLI